MGKGDKQAVESDSDEIIHLDYRDFGGWGAEKFARYVNNLLHDRHNVDLHTFRLHWNHYVPLNCKDVRSWISYAVKHKVKVLDVELRMYDKTNLPPGIFTCRSLQELNLQWGGAPYQDIEHKGLVPPDIIRLPSLKKLTLRDVEVSSLPLSSFIDRSPGLEDLHLIESATCLKLIASKVLKRLTLDGSMYGVENLVISAPHLISFECTGCSLKDISWRDEPSLERARIHTRGSTFGGESRFTEVLVHAKELALFGSDIKVLRKLRLLLGGDISWRDQPSLERARIATWGRTFCDESRFTEVLVHAKELALFGSDIKVMLEKELPTCSVFQNLTTLELGKWDLTKDFYAVLRFLQLSPRLEELTLMHGPLDKGAETDGMPTDGVTFQCPLLGSVIIQCSEGDVGIDKLVNALVASGISSDKITITSCEDIKNKAHAEKIRAEEKRPKKRVKENPEWENDGPDSEQ